MRKPRGSLSSGLVLSGTAAATTWVAMVSWGGFTADNAAYLEPLLYVGATIAATGAVGRWWRVPGVLVFLAQLMTSALMLCLVLTGAPLPIGGGWAELTNAFRDAYDSAQKYASPVPSTVPGIHPLLISGGLASMLVVDLLACTIRKVPLAGLPLLMIYSVPISMLDSGVSLWVFVPTAAGFMVLLFLHESELVSRWGRPLAVDQSFPGSGRSARRTGTARSNAGAIGSVATGLAVVVPLLIPTLDLRVLDFGAGAGDDSDVKIVNPTGDLLRDLNRGRDIPLIDVRTDDPDPDYLRVTSLNRFTENEWSPGNRDIPSDQTPDGAMPPPEGVSSQVGGTVYDYDVAINDDFDSEWLPTYFPLTSIVADGDWRYDDQTMDFFRWDEDLDTRNMDYEMTGVELDLRGSDLAEAAPSVTEVSQEFLELPDDLPEMVTDLARQVTEDATTRFDEAVALQDWFREDFEYSLDEGPRRSGVDDLVAFLSEDGRVGYCEQFAASMSVMARVIGIPARMVVGFLQPDEVADGLWRYSAHDLHAWSELYFDGYGWVRFEPTPRDDSNAPSYTQGRVGDPGDPSIAPSQSESASANPLPDARRPSAEATPESATGGAGRDSTFPWVRVVLVVGGGLLVVVLSLLPRMLRRRARERRLGGGPELAWEELRATAVDLGLLWPGARSPREVRDHLVELFGAPADEFAERPARGPTVNPDAVVAVDRIVRDLELLRYSRAHQPETGLLRAEVETCIEALEAGVAPRARRRATWLPASVVSHGARARVRASAEEQPVRTPAGGVVEHVG